MSWWTSIGHRLGYLGQRRRFDAEIEREVRFHIDSHIDDLVRSGVSREEAVRLAQRQFGPRLRSAEDARQAWQFLWLERLISSLRYALRQCRKHPAFAAIVIVTLGLGIGANSAVFTAVDAVFLRPLPFPEADRLVRIYQRNPKMPLTITSPARLADWDRLNHTLQALSGSYTEDVSETSGELPEKLTLASVAPRYLETWGIVPALGRDFSPAEFQEGGPAVVQISDAYWRRRFNADPSAIGQQLRLRGASLTIVGVMPASFRFPVRDVDVWSPVVLTGATLQYRAATWYTAFGRMKPGVSISQARADLETVQSQLGKAYPRSDGDLHVDVRPLDAEIVGRLRGSVWLLFGSATLLLLIACVNVAALLLVRSTERRHEIAIRVSLGASRRFVVSQLLTETGMLAAAGGVLGLGIATVAARTFRVVATTLPRADEIRTDWRSTLYACAAAAAVTVACGLLPALRATAGRLTTRLIGTSRTHVSGRHRIQWILAGLQVSLAAILLVGAGLLVRSLQELGRTPRGFDASSILTFHVSGSYAETNDYARLTGRIDRAIERLGSIPGVEAAATSGSLPGVPGQFKVEIKVEGRSDTDPPVTADSRYVSVSYFDTLQIPLLTGERCRQTSPTAIQTAMVNRSFANTYFAGASPIGHRIRGAFVADQSALIQGIVADSREQGLHVAPSPIVYWCFSAPGPSPFFLVRTAGDPAAMATTVRRSLKELEPRRAAYGLTPLEEHLDDAYRESRLRALILAAFSMSAVLLAFVGLYGTLSYLVNVRRREVGVRLALGALRGQIVGRFLAQGLGVAALACAVGLGLSAIGGRLLSGMLYGVSPTDPTTLAAVAAIVLAGAGVASLVPSVRGALVEPVQVLRDE